MPIYLRASTLFTLLLSLTLSASCGDDNSSRSSEPSGRDTRLTGGSSGPKEGAPSADELEGGGQAEAGEEPSAEPFLELGTGFRRFEAVTDGQQVPIIKGIQGGYHVWGSFKGRGFTGIDISLLFELYLEGEVIANADYFEYELPVDRSGDYLYSGVSVIYFENERVEPSSGHEMTLTLTVTTSDEQILTDEVTLRPICCE